jgi:cell division septum initiation protein DivIVA
LEVTKLLEYLQHIIETSNKLPMTGKVVVSKKEISDIVDQIICSLPDELKKARWVLAEKDRIVNDALKEAEMVRRKNEQTILNQIENHDVTKEAERRAEKIISSAQKTAEEIREGSRIYAENVLIELDKQVKAYNDAMLSNIKAEMEDFLKAYHQSITATSNNLKENIKEIKRM